MEATASSARREARDWIEENFDPQLSVRAWLERLADSGWAAPAWPREWHGRGLPAEEAALSYAEFNRVDAPGPPAGLGVMLAAPTIIANAGDELKRQFVRAVLVGDHAWCQLFSEPGAGSDLAGLQTRAERDGSEFVVNGQKVWTSGAHLADYGMLLARTDPDVPKHRGISYFAFPMRQPGVEVRPLVQMTGESGFSEVFFTDARVPASAIIGELNGGWAVALSTLGFERTGLGAGSGIGFRLAAPGGSRVLAQQEVSVGEFIAAARAQPRSFGTNSTAMIGGSITPLVALAAGLGRDRDQAVRQDIVRLYTLSSVNTWNGLRARAARQAGGRAGPEASLGKLMSSRIARQWRDTASLIAGPREMLAGADGPLDGRVASQLLATPGPSIYGGSDQIQRNIISERVLGLPREPDSSKTVPFRQLRVGTQAGPGEAS
ncbi:MAG TPA: acyl-CoA dehydrogenase family protein [Streptosporangiaceae bacterium]|nr:acyl-CoA dehydrogenase family protein [Streptosporangiaceae bacterium]